MDLSYGPEYEVFREETRAFINSHRDQAPRGQGMKSPEVLNWQKLLIENGYAARTIPKAYGGYGAQPDILKSRIIGEEFARAQVNSGLGGQGISMLVPTLLEVGTEEQKQQFIGPTLRGEMVWCQGYSEPGAGSDLASLQMSAVRDGDDYVLNGSKIWTTLAQWADMIFCLVRTSKEGKPQQGISFIIFPMDLPGISVSPLPTLDGPVEGQQEINQVFFENVRVPIAEALVGKENEGWTYAKYLLQFERGNAYAPGLRNMLGKAKKIASIEQSNGEPLIRDPDFARKIAGMEIKIDSLDATEQRIFSALSAGQAVGPESSMLKCEGSATQQAITELLLEATGTYAEPFVQDTFAIARAGANADLPTPQYALPVAPGYFNFRKASIYAGSNEIQRNIMAKMVLGL